MKPLFVAILLVLQTKMMGYDLHITKSENPWNAKQSELITIEEWKEFVSTEPTLRLDGYAEAGSAENKIRINQEGLTSWINSDGEILGWFSYYEGVVSCDGPNDETIRKMYQISKKFNAILIGDESEHYGSDGEVINEDK